MVRQSQGFLKPTAAAQLLIHGRVQGVGYRFFAQASAERLGLHGWVHNLSDGSVEAYAEGPRPTIETWLLQLHKGPTMCRVDRIDVDWQTPQRNDSSFTII